MTAVFYISGHGFGHASRAIAVINALAACRPDLRIIIRSAVAPWLVNRTVRAGVELSPAECDTGVVQIDSLSLDEAETLVRARAFMAAFPGRVRDEVAWLESVGAALVVADLPPLGIAAAKAAGIPGVALGNFTWDWIYAGYAGAEDLATAIGAIYADTTVALRLPMWGGFATMPKVLDLPFVSRQSSRDPLDTRRALGLAERERLVLVSFGGYGLNGLNLDALDRLNGYRVLRPTEAEVTALYARGLRYEDLVAAVDVVVTKPGYGIISECLANATALLYTSRGHFVEYDVLVAAMPRFLRSAFIGHPDLFSGNWGSYLDRLLAQPAPAERPATDGAAVAADRLAGMI